MRKLLGVGAALAAVLPPGGAGSVPKLIDCTCYDLVRADTARSPSIVLRNREGWNLFEVSADRTKLLYSHGPLYVARVDGTGSHFLALGYVHNAELSPNGRHVAYSTDACGLCVVDVDGTNRHDFGIAHVSRWASWSHDSRRLVFAVYASATSASAALTVANADGSGRRVLVPPQYGLAAPASGSRPHGRRVTTALRTSAVIRSRSTSCASRTAGTSRSPVAARRCGRRTAGGSSSSGTRPRPR